jgi:hypothetical protein
LYSSAFLTMLAKSSSIPPPSRSRLNGPDGVACRTFR